MIKTKMEEEKQEKIIIEKRTIEELLRDLRTEKQWSYMNVVVELNKLGIFLQEKEVKKWEYGLKYPDLDTIYKLSEIYFIPCETLVMAKSNSYNKGYQAIHQTFIKWFCYLTGISLKIGYIMTNAFIYIALVISFLFFIEMCNMYLELKRK